MFVMLMMVKVLLIEFGWKSHVKHVVKYLVGRTKYIYLLRLEASLPLEQIVRGIQIDDGYYYY